MTIFVRKSEKSLSKKHEVKGRKMGYFREAFSPKSI
jgi:hypothetical protein